MIKSQAALRVLQSTACIAQACCHIMRLLKMKLLADIVPGEISYVSVVTASETNAPHYRVSRTHTPCRAPCAATMFRFCPASGSLPYRMAATSPGLAPRFPWALAAARQWTPTKPPSHLLMPSEDYHGQTRGKCARVATECTSSPLWRRCSVWHLDETSRVPSRLTYPIACFSSHLYCRDCSMLIPATA
jgi:hypothetical protein